MKYQAELTFFRNILENMNINTHIISPEHHFPNFDKGLRHILHDVDNYDQLFTRLDKILDANFIYRIEDDYLCNYIFFLLPDTDTPQILTIGPYILFEPSTEIILKKAEELKINPSLYPQLEKYYAGIPFLADESTLFTITNTFGAAIWGGMDNFHIQHVHSALPDYLEPVAMRPSFKEPTEPLLSMHMLEERYEHENQMMQAVSLGLTQKAEMIFTLTAPYAIEQRASDPVRNIKNYNIILNTLLRKAAEAGSVHPLHIDSLSHYFALKIELVNSVNAALQLQKTMIRKYCLLVNNHSMKNYSLLVRKVLAQIDSDLTLDLSLKTQAELLNVNASYLSTLFKKETGSNLTDYVSRKRIEHAIFLLNSTNMQIQIIAQYCGIPDVNYFTKTFKKYVGKTPKEYREDIKSPHFQTMLDS
ncbi:MAG: helix-turn-helix domain-containing protein [Ruminococcus sp.]|nr:helix-turn-helix domain-containing protein [Ruminococcus sp.]